MDNILVVGGGMVGSVIAADLSSRFSVTIADRNESQLQSVKQKFPALELATVDVIDVKKFRELLSQFDFVVNAVPGFLGFRTLKTIIDSGKNVVDISFFQEDAFELDELARKKNVTAIVDCGIAPGLGNFILGYHNGSMKIDSFECLVGGLPKIRTWPFQYKAPFSPVDVIEEYTRPARFVQNGVLVTREALSDREYVQFDRVGTLESFNTDGLRSILKTMSHIPDMREKTLRYPGHVEYIEVLKSAGFFNPEKIHFSEGHVSPLEMSSKLLFREWKLEENEPEFTVMRITISGGEETVRYELYDEYDPVSGISSMARTTGYTATAAVHLLMEKRFAKPGVYPPELVGSEAGVLDFVLQHLAERNVIAHRTG
jgi:lysine 6-dehydrogenase